MPSQCPNPKCIGHEKRLTSRKYKNKEKNPRPPSTSHRSSSDNSKSRNKAAQKLKSKRSKDNLKNLSFNKPRDHKNKKRQASQSSKSSTSTYLQKLRTTNTFGQVSGNSQNHKKQICTCRKEHHGTHSRNSHENLRSTDPVKKNKKRKITRRQYRKTSKRESNRPRRCFVTLCACVRSSSLDELRACKCTSPHRISSHCECCSVKGKQKEKKRVTGKNTSKNNIQMKRHTANPSTSKRKSALKHSHKLSAAKPNEEQSVIIRSLDTVRRGIDRFNAFVIRWVTRQQ
ncbi:PREDICTED: uncharacterized protein LOC108755497 [Trachymyrmex septentrionalis]|uniref:uncharacterized protein LOC108755497 n=1 Tax=Trachymyrmex septentrionalis TaxID=34720 RepID=UPI00084F783A|nr:PREDICTED: uncharacterized protein LOC108755497 [Trachymyrmex septentrionalis]